ncbi:hypothetical protein [Hymenobacter siberiensis]|uniref:hypothetical protein n=1 Tax=Hymenobacter siberiensis TaxID=2848396 RepID=UPI001C1E8C98|nr:hypothetical protein [Hymenobacter siberiensis]
MTSIPVKIDYSALDTVRGMTPVELLQLEVIHVRVKLDDRGFAIDFVIDAPEAEAPAATPEVAEPKTPQKRK